MMENSHVTFPRKALFEIEEKILSIHAMIYNIMDLYVDDSAAEDEVDPALWQSREPAG